MGLSEEISCWALEESFPHGVTMWVSSVTQWNDMDRPINIDALGFHNIQKSHSRGDSIIHYFNKNKKNQIRMIVSPRNITP